MSEQQQVVGIYKIMSPNNRVYIGQSLDIHRRWLTYRKIKNVEKQVQLYNSFLKYGVENHLFEVIHLCSPGELNDLEIYYGELFNCLNPKVGLNSRIGNARGRNSELSNLKNSLSQKNRYANGAINGMLGKTPSAELTKKRVDSRRGYRHSYETKQKMRFKHTGMKKPHRHLKTSEQRNILSLAKKKWWEERKITHPKQLKQKKFSDEVNLKKGRKGELHSWWGKGKSRVLQYDMNGNKINDFSSASQAARFLNKKNGGGNILKCCDKKIPTSYGYKWEYKV